MPTPIRFAIGTPIAETAAHIEKRVKTNLPAVCAVRDVTFEPGPTSAPEIFTIAETLYAARDNAMLARQKCNADVGLSLGIGHVSLRQTPALQTQQFWLYVVMAVAQDGVIAWTLPADLYPADLQTFVKTACDYMFKHLPHSSIDVEVRKAATLAAVVWSERGFPDIDLHRISLN
jgi:hypothetical protein